MHLGKSPLGKPRAYPVSLASGKPHFVRLSLFGFGLSELGSGDWKDSSPSLRVERLGSGSHHRECTEIFKRSFSVTSVCSVVKSFGKPTRLATPKDFQGFCFTPVALYLLHETV